MALDWLERRFVTIYGVWIYVALTSASPEVAFPFNSQVPTVARVGQDYAFQLSPSTFVPDDSNFTYSLSDQPAWLSIDSSSAALSGAPAQSDAGAVSFMITAADANGAAQMGCTLVVSEDPPPQIEGDISEQLAAFANLSSGYPPVVTILPASQFRFDFQQASFIDIVQRRLYYYSTLADHTPLPSWLLFDSEQLTFSGTAPQLSAVPQTWDIELIASDVEGFAGAKASFTVAIGTQQLIFVPQEQQVNISTGMQVDFQGLQTTLFLNGDEVDPETLKSAIASVPSWLSFDSTTLAITGTVPDEVQEENGTVTVVDQAGNEATVFITFTSGQRSTFAGTIGTLTTRSGSMFRYQLPQSILKDQSADLMVTLPATAKWLKFDSSTRELSGEVPTQTSTSTIQATLSVKASGMPDSQSQVFEIRVLPSSPTASKTQSSATSSLMSNPGLANSGSKSSPHLSGGVVAAIVVSAVVGTAILILCLLMCCRRRRRSEGYVDATSPKKRSISRPILAPPVDAIAMTTELQTDVEKIADSEFGRHPAEEQEHPPQLALNLPTPRNSKRSKWSKRFSRVSLASSIGNGENAIRADSNIPEIGRDSAVIHTPHDSFSVPTEIARSSRQLSDLSPSKRALKRLREKRQSRQSIGLGIDTGGAGILPRHSLKGANGHIRAVSSLGPSTALDGDSLASASTRGTSVLSTRPLEFPRPPTRSTFNASRSTHPFSLTEAEKRKSIRLVDASDSIPDQRSLQDKRQSFIRNRASTTFASPLFAHGSRASSGNQQNGRSLSYVASGSQRRSKRGKSQISESSSVEPPPRNPRRLSTRIRSTFGPNFPRAVTKSSMGTSTHGHSNSDSWETSSFISESDLAAQLALPRHERSFVLPGEASPTPPPAPPASRRGSSARQSSLVSESDKPRHKWKDRLREHSSSPLSTAVAVAVADPNALPGKAKASQNQRNRLSEPISLVSNDSFERTKLDRPRLVQTNSKRPVSVERVQRLSSLKAETEDARPGSEMWEAMAGAGLMPPNCTDGKDGTQRSNMSGPAFL